LGVSNLVGYQITVKYNPNSCATNLLFQSQFNRNRRNLITPITRLPLPDSGYSVSRDSSNHTAATTYQNHQSQQSTLQTAVKLICSRRVNSTGTVKTVSPQSRDFLFLCLQASLQLTVMQSSTSHRMSRLYSNVDDDNHLSGYESVEEDFTEEDCMYGYSCYPFGNQEISSIHSFVNDLTLLDESLCYTFRIYLMRSNRLQSPEQHYIELKFTPVIDTESLTSLLIHSYTDTAR
jgi:hypothetical protein